MAGPISKIFSMLFLMALVGCVATPPAPTGQPQDRVSLASDKTRTMQPQTDPADLQTLAAGNTRFAFDLYQQLSTDDGNLFFSPYSISLALAMTEAGARGETLEEMDRVLHFDLPQEDLHPTFNALDQALTEQGKKTQAYTDPNQPTPAEPQGFQLNIANSIWGQKDYGFLPAYLDTLAVNYGAGMRLWDFEANPEEGRQAINGWVSEQTREKIKDLIPEGVINPLTRLVLANAIYFKAAWLNTFQPENTHPAPFHRLDGSTVEAQMMNQVDLVGYGKGQSWQAVRLPYVSPSFGMVVLVPDEGEFETFEQSLDAARLEEILGTLQHTQVQLGFPKFENESSFALKDALTALGMAQAFTAGQADFSGMAGNRELIIDAVVHKAYVKVDEAGTEAAAATAVIVAATGAAAEPVSLTVDRPFIYLVQERQTGTILFMGRVLEP